MDIGQKQARNDGNEWGHLMILLLDVPEASKDAVKRPLRCPIWWNNVLLAKSQTTATTVANSAHYTGTWRLQNEFSTQFVPLAFHYLNLYG